MQLKLCKTTNAKNEINKTFTDELTLNIALKNDFDILSPSIKLELPTGINAYSFNYCYIPELNRYYFIDDIESINFRIWNFICSCDVLETYKAEILASNARLRRSIKTGDYLSANIESNVNADITTHQSNKGFVGEPELILSTVGNSGK